MKILCLGDIVGKAGRQAFCELVPDLKKEFLIDFTIVNAENAAGGSGITPRIANQLFREGADVLTLGDHTWDRQEIEEYLQKQKNIIRPANFPEGTPGKGWCIATLPSGIKIGVINLLGRVFMRYNIDCPFRSLSRMVEIVKQETSVIVVDMHAETTSEKVALGFYIDGQVSAVVGTHTHIQTADEKLLPKGTAYITDLGMSGPYNSVIGQNKEKIIKRFVTSLPQRFEVAKEDPWLCGVIIDVDEETGLARDIVRLQRKLETAKAFCDDE
jgi:metallophosphoesterase (TIGR00282 family)